MFERLTQRARKAAVLAQEEARSFGHNYIGTEHLLLGLVKENEGVAARILSNLDVDPDGVHREVVRRLGVGPGTDPSYEVGSRIEPRGFGRSTLFRGRVTGIRVELALPEPLPVNVDLDYSYCVDGDSEGGPPSQDPEALTAAIRPSLEATDLELLEEALEKVGEVSLETFPGMREVTVTVAKAPRPGESPVSGFSLSATFRR